MSAGYGGENTHEAVLLLWGKGQFHVDGVYHPPKDNMECVIGSFPYLYLLEGKEFLLV